jgi:hypothetical protein
VHEQGPSLQHQLPSALLLLTVLLPLTLRCCCRKQMLPWLLTLGGWAGCGLTRSNRLA